MSITKTTITKQLKSVNMEELRTTIQERFVENNIESNLLNKGDNSLTLEVKKTVYKTQLHIERPRHRPFEVEVEVDYGAVNKTKDVTRSRRPENNRQGGMLSGNYRWIWLLFIFGGAILVFLESIARFLLYISQPVRDELTFSQQIIAVILFFGSILLFLLYGLPFLSKQKAKRLQNFDYKVLSIVENTIMELNNEKVGKIVRCWSCFEKIDPQDNVCAYCGKTQK